MLIAIFAVTQTGKSGVDMQQLLEFLEFGKHPLNLVVAPTFGLTPRLLMDRLHEQAEEHRKDLQGSQAVQGCGETSKTAPTARGA